MMKDVIFWGDSLQVLRDLPSESVDCGITSPPYYALRDYGISGQLGIERTPTEYINRLADIFDEFQRVLKPEGTLWLNLGDSYTGYATGSSDPSKYGLQGGSQTQQVAAKRPNKLSLPTKNLLMIPHRVAIELQSRGWYVRTDIIWHKPNSKPESVKDRPTRNHEYVFLLSKSPRYYYDADSIRVPHKLTSKHRVARAVGTSVKYANDDYLVGNLKADNISQPRDYQGYENLEERIANGETSLHPKGANRRTIWKISTRPYKGAHFAVMPQKLVDLCLLAGCPVGGVVMDPFGGSGTVAVSAIQHDRHYQLIELNPSYIELAQQRIREARNRDPFQETILANGKRQKSLFI